MEKVFTLQKLANANHQGFSSFGEARCYVFISTTLSLLNTRCSPSTCGASELPLCAAPVCLWADLPPFSLSLTLQNNLDNVQAPDHKLPLQIFENSYEASRKSSLPQLSILHAVHTSSSGLEAQ